MQTIYEPKGKAREYGELALNIYTGCSHGCTYCYAPSVLRKEKDIFHSSIVPRENILEETINYLKSTGIKGKEIFLCFTCDPFPNGVDCSITYDIIRAIKDSGNYVAILTKGVIDSEKLFSLLDKNDRFGVTISCGENMAKISEPNASFVHERISYLVSAQEHGIKNFVSFEPVLEESFVYGMIKNATFIDEYRIGKLNYAKSTIDWKVFGETCERLCKENNRNYFLKAGLREEMGI